MSSPSGFTDGTDIEVITAESGRWEARVQPSDGGTLPFLACRYGQQLPIWIGGETYVFSPAAPAARGRGVRQTASDDILCPVPGVVIEVGVAEDDVEAGGDLVIIESMKTDQIVKSPRPGTVQRV